MKKKWTRGKSGQHFGRKEMWCERCYKMKKKWMSGENWPREKYWPKCDDGL